MRAHALSAAINYLSAMPEIDGNRIGLYGHSMGGHLGPGCAAADKRLRAIVSAGGIYEMSYWEGLSDAIKSNFSYAWGLIIRMTLPIMRRADAHSKELYLKLSVRF